MGNTVIGSRLKARASVDPNANGGRLEIGVLRGNLEAVLEGGNLGLGNVQQRLRVSVSKLGRGADARAVANDLLRSRAELRVREKSEKKKISHGYWS